MYRDRSWDVLFVGAGVIGSIFAARLAGAGHNVTLLDCGERLRELRKDGLVLEPVFGGARVSVRPPTTERLEPADPYDLVVVPVRNDQADALLPMLAANTVTPSVLFMVNNPAGYQSWSGAVRSERLLLGSLALAAPYRTARQIMTWSRVFCSRPPSGHRTGTSLLACVR